MPRKRNNWVRLRNIGEISILVDRISGRFGTQIGDGVIAEHETMAQAEIYAHNFCIKYTDAVIVYGNVRDDVPWITIGELTYANEEWCDSYGAINTDKVFARNPEIVEQILDLNEEYRCAMTTAQKARQSAWDLVCKLQPLEP